MSRRVIVHLAWGDRYCQEAASSASESLDIGIPRVLITDEASAAALTGSRVFHRVVSVPIIPKSLHAKAHLYEWLPAEFDSFLFLDSDTKVLADIEYGFRQAEEFGIAAAMAPHYTLEAFWNFRRLMEGLNMRAEGQMQYNTGVIFFSRTASVWRVMMRWARLVDSYSTAFHSDQPFFSVALEQCRFNPFTLSPAFNYRAFGETASGPIRIWHSRASVPFDVNALTDIWPGRRFSGDRRIYPL